jgi:hypothetical protein
MKADRFDALARLLSGRRTRRSIVRRGGVGIATATIAMAGRRRAAAQDATPVPAVVNRSFLFVQTFQSGTFEPKSGEADTYALTLIGGTGQTVYFSDRPDRLAGVVETAAFLAGLGFAPDDPPNAALVAQTETGEDILVLELFSPGYDEAVSTVTYDARVLADYAGVALASLAARRADQAIAPAFGAASLFIDGCGSGQCWDATVSSCVSCQCFNQGVQGCPCITGTQSPCVDPSMVCVANDPNLPGGQGSCWYP